MKKFVATVYVALCVLAIPPVAASTEPNSFDAKNFQAFDWCVVFPVPPVCK